MFELFPYEIHETYSRDEFKEPENKFVVVLREIHKLKVEKEKKAIKG